MLEYCIDDLRDLQLSSLPCIGDGITESLKYPRIRSHYGLSASLDSCQQQVNDGCDVNIASSSCTCGRMPLKMAWKWLSDKLQFACCHAGAYFLPRSAAMRVPRAKTQTLGNWGPPLAEIASRAYYICIYKAQVISLQCQEVRTVPLIHRRSSDLAIARPPSDSRCISISMIISLVSAGCLPCSIPLTTVQVSITLL
jgi:hypothetical protein